MTLFLRSFGKSNLRDRISSIYPPPRMLRSRRCPVSTYGSLARERSGGRGGGRGRRPFATGGETNGPLQNRPMHTTMCAAFGVVTVLVVAWWCRVPRPASCPSSESTPLYLRSAYPLWDPQTTPSRSVAEPLLLTPYLRNGHILRAKHLAKVTDVFRPHRVASYSGYFTVSDEHNSNLFFWFFPAPVTIHTFPVEQR